MTPGIVDGAPPRLDQDSQSRTRRRWLLLATVLLAYAHVTTLLDMKDLWWDESLSLQRAEEALPALLRGVLLIRDGFTQVVTIDQHPFFSFLLQGALLRVAGDSEFVLRYISVMAATLLVPVVWVWSRWLVRRSLAAPSTPIWAALLAAINPFMLWFGQEARPYALWATLALLSTYLLVRATETQRIRGAFLAGFVLTEVMFVFTHFYAILLLPVHAAILFLWLARRSMAQAIVAAACVLTVGGAVALYGAWVLLSQGGGGNFASISLAILIPDVVNAFSLGLSVDLADVWWIDMVFGVLALVGAVWGLRSRRTIRQGGWILPAYFVVPIVILLGVNLFRPLYMTARHMSLLIGAFVILVSVGIAVIWQMRRWLAGVIVAGLVIAVAYSTFNYFTVEEYAKDDYAGLGEYMAGRMAPGDAVLVYQAPSWRIFDYYVPVQPVYDAIEQGAPLGVFGIPLLNRSQDETIAWLQTLGDRYQRVWMLRFGNHLVYDPEGRVEDWLRNNFLLVRDVTFLSNSSLHALLFLPKVPVFDTLPATVQHPVTVEFGDLIRLAGYDAPLDMASSLPAPVRLYWQVLEKPARRYKYIMRLVEQTADGQERVLAAVEREPYEGSIPTLYWDPGKTIMEYVEFPPISAPPAPGSQLHVTFQLYDAETLEKLPATKVEGGEIAADAVTVALPYESQ